MGWKWEDSDQATVYQFNRIPQFGELSPREQLAAEAACRATLQHFLENEFSSAISSEEAMDEIRDMVKVGKMCGHKPRDILRRAFAGFLVRLIDPSAVKTFDFNFDAYNPDPE